MKRIDKLLFGLIFGSSFPLLFGLMTISFWFLFVKNEEIVLYFVFAGLLLGILIDSVLLKRLINKTFELPIWILVGFYIFYNICIYGFFMGFPVFNLIMGIVAGYYFGKRIVLKNVTSSQKEIIIKRVSYLTGFIMSLICISSASMAMLEETIGEELQNMAGLGFEITKGMIIAIILIGGISLIISQYYLTKITLIKTIRTCN